MHKELSRQERCQFRLVQDESLEKAILIDLDGTLALFEGDVPEECKRDPYNGMACESDFVNPPVHSIIEHYKADHKILLASGRDGAAEDATKRWLKKHKIHYDNLYMRGAGDRRSDDVIKEEIFNQFIRGRFFITFVLDDRNRVVDLWRRLGLACFQVNYGDF